MKCFAEKSKDVSGDEGARVIEKKTPTQGHTFNKVERERERGQVPVAVVAFICLCLSA